MQGNYPEWLAPNLQRAFGPDAVPEAMAMATRAPIDLRVNTLKSDPEKAGRALEGVKARQMPELKNGFRIPAPDAIERGEAVEAIPAYSKGWVEVQDMGSQIAAAASCASSRQSKCPNVWPRDRQASAVCAATRQSTSQ